MSFHVILSPDCYTRIRVQDFTMTNPFCLNCGAIASCCEAARLRRDDLDRSTRLIQKLLEKINALEAQIAETK